MRKLISIGGVNLKEKTDEINISRMENKYENRGVIDKGKNLSNLRKNQLKDHDSFEYRYGCNYKKFNIRIKGEQIHSL